MAKVKIGTLLQATVAEWQQVTWTVKQAQDMFSQAYKHSLRDVAGANWEKTWQSWDNFHEVIESVEKQIKEICLPSGMQLTVFNRYRTAARKHCFHKVPFKFGANFTIGEIRQAQELIEGYEEGTPEQKATRAYAEIRAAKNLKGAKSQVEKAASILPFPSKQQTRSQYREQLVACLYRHFATPAVKEALRGDRQLCTLVRKVEELARHRRATDGGTLADAMPPEADDGPYQESGEEEQ